MKNITVKDHEFAELRRLLEEWSGIYVGEGKAYLVESRLSGFARECGCDDFTQFIAKLKGVGSTAIKAQVVDLMTTNETLWFRDMHPFRIFSELLLPQYAQQVREGKRNALRIWSAASSTGQEPYSMAITFREAVAKYPELSRMRCEILASDISPTVIETAKAGKYDSIAIGRGLTPEQRSRYFVNEGRQWSILPEVRSMVQFRQYNLQDSFSLLGNFDIVLCRNVAIYFSDDFKRNLYRKIHGSLPSGGILLLGASESLSAYSDSFKMKSHESGIYYEKP